MALVHGRSLFPALWHCFLALFRKLLHLQRVHQWAQQDRLVMLGCLVDHRESCRRLEETQMPTMHEISRKRFPRWVEMWQLSSRRQPP